VGDTEDVDEVLTGGVANAGSVVRRGAFVLRPSNPHSRSVHDFLRQLRRAGFDGASLPVELQADGRERLFFIEGDVPIPPYPSWAQTDSALGSIAVLLRSFHEAASTVPLGPGPWSKELADPAGGSIVCHNDLCLENVVFRNGRAVGLLDFDFAAPGRPIFDIAAFTRMCVPIDDDRSARRLGWEEVDRPRRLRLVADTYGLDETNRKELIEQLDHSVQTGGAFVQRRVDAGDPNFTRMHREMGGQERYRRRRDWWEGSREVFTRALS
jgi:Phosphotransferase enzyme family